MKAGIDIIRPGKLQASQRLSRSVVLVATQLACSPRYFDAGIETVEVEVPPPQLLGVSPPRVGRTAVRVESTWSEAGAPHRVTFGASEQDYCFTEALTRHSGVVHVENTLASPATTWAFFSAGVLGMGLLGLGAYQHWGQDMPLTKPGEEGDKMTGTGGLFLLGAIATAALPLAVAEFAAAADRQSQRIPYVFSQPSDLVACGPPRKLRPKTFVIKAPDAALALRANRHGNAVTTGDALRKLGVESFEVDGRLADNSSTLASDVNAVTSNIINAENFRTELASGRCSASSLAFYERRLHSLNEALDDYATPDDALKVVARYLFVARPTLAHKVAKITTDGSYRLWLVGMFDDFMVTSSDDVEYQRSQVEHPALLEAIGRSSSRGAASGVTFAAQRGDTVTLTVQGQGCVLAILLTEDPERMLAAADRAREREDRDRQAQREHEEQMIVWSCRDRCNKCVSTCDAERSIGNSIDLCRQRCYLAQADCSRSTSTSASSCQ